MIVSQSRKARSVFRMLLGVLASICGTGFLAGSVRALSGAITDMERSILVVAAVLLVLCCIASCLVDRQGRGGARRSR